MEFRMVRLVMSPALRTTLLLVLLLTASTTAGQLPLDPAREAGQSVTAAFEGWFPNEDGSFTVLVGYFNRNTRQTLDIPIGPNNRIEPGGPDQGQPTHFLPRRQWGVFGIRVPKDFGDKRLTWTITANGKTTQIPVGLIKGYQVEPFKEQAQGNTPPRIRFEATGKDHAGPPRGVMATYSATVGAPLTLTMWANDDLRVDPDEAPTPPAAARGDAAGRGGDPQGRGDAGRGDAAGRGGRGAGRGPAAAPIRVVLSKYRGPGDVTFSTATPAVDMKDGGKTTATATFSAPGEYWLRVQVNDRSGDGGGGFQCCWTNTYVRVNVTGGTSK
jgi:hypothetical protein